MVANSAVFAAIVLMLGVFEVAAETTFLAPYRRALLREHGVYLGLFLLVVYINLFALCYSVARLLFLKDTGIKLHHLDRQLTTQDTVLTDLTRRLHDDGADHVPRS